MSCFLQRAESESLLLCTTLKWNGILFFPYFIVDATVSCRSLPLFIEYALVLFVVSFFVG